MSTLARLATTSPELPRDITAVPVSAVMSEPGIPTLHADATLHQAADLITSFELEGQPWGRTR